MSETKLQAGGGAPPPFELRAEKVDDTYVPSYAFGADRINAAQDAIHEQVVALAGWLRPEDSLKLYELAYFASGPILEIGTYCGKSTVVITTALRDAGHEVSFYSLDIDGDALSSATSTLRSRGLDDRVQLVRGSVSAFFRAFPWFTPSWVFVDGDHSFKGVAADLAVLRDHVPVGGILLFHDYLDDRNADPTDADYGVTGAIEASWVRTECDYAGTFGCAALFRRRESSARKPPRAVLDLVALDPPLLRLRSTVVVPALSALKRVKRAATGRARPS